MKIAEHLIVVDNVKLHKEHKKFVKIKKIFLNTIRTYQNINKEFQ